RPTARREREAVPDRPAPHRRLPNHDGDRHERHLQSRESRGRDDLPLTSPFFHPAGGHDGPAGFNAPPFGGAFFPSLRLRPGTCACGAAASGSAGCGLDRSPDPGTPPPLPPREPPPSLRSGDYSPASATTVAAEGCVPRVVGEGKPLPFRGVLTQIEWW